MQDTPYGYCHCGCGEKTKPAPYTNKRRGMVKDQPNRFISGHHTRLPEYQNKPGDDRARFWSKVDRTGDDDCWLWRGQVTRQGYGRIKVARRFLHAHRFAYELEVGPIPEGLTIDHLCCNRLCQNPAHMEPVTAGENSRRANSGKTHCKRGHPLSGDNIRFDKRGGRVCRTCARLWWRENKRSAA